MTTEHGMTPLSSNRPAVPEDVEKALATVRRGYSVHGYPEPAEAAATLSTAIAALTEREWALREAIHNARLQLDYRDEIETKFPKRDVVSEVADALRAALTNTQQPNPEQEAASSGGEKVTAEQERLLREHASSIRHDVRLGIHNSGIPNLASAKDQLAIADAIEAALSSTKADATQQVEKERTDMVLVPKALVQPGASVRERIEGVLRSSPAHNAADIARVLAAVDAAITSAEGKGEHDEAALELLVANAEAALTNTQEPNPEQEAGRASSGGEKVTPAARWREKGEPDPHAGHYDGERATLCGGHLTDDEVAYRVAMLLRSDLDHEVVLTMAKDRIRWLSRKLVAAGGERIVRAAILFEDGIYSAAPPGRHGDCLRLIQHPDFVGPEDQGFLTSTGRFVRREEARRIAEAAKQLLPNAREHRELFSEDVW